MIEALFDLVGEIVGSLAVVGKRRRAAPAAQTDDDGSSSHQAGQEATTRTATTRRSAQALCAYLRQTSELNDPHVEDPEQFLDAHNARAGEASLWLSEMATTTQEQDYMFYGSLSPEKMRLELMLDITGEQVPPTISDREAVEIVQATAQSLKDRSADS